MTEAPTQADLEELGFALAADKVKKDRELARKLRTAFEHFRVVTQEQLNRFQVDLREKTFRVEGKNRHGDITSYSRLVFTPIEHYQKVPPKFALNDLRKAKALGCFDRFEIATIEIVRNIPAPPVPDPIIFGLIDGSNNKYFVTQWDKDVSINDILREDEG